MTLTMGYAQNVITPSLERPVFLAGFGRNRTAESVHDDLTVRAVALTQGETQLVVAALDLIGLPRHHCREIEQRVGQQAAKTPLLLACTHTHHGPDTIGFWGPDEMRSGVDEQYMAFLKETIVETILEALSNPQPAYLRAATVQVTGLIKNWRDPGILDETLTCLQFCRPQTAELLATWLIYPCHPEVLGDQNPHITSDYIDGLRRLVQAESGAPCLAMVGALGGMLSPDAEERSFAESEAMGQALAQAALATLATTECRPVRSLAYGRTAYTLPTANPLFRTAMENGLLPNVLNEDDTITTEASLIRLDTTWLFAVPGELFPRPGLAYKAKMEAAGATVAAVIGLANDELGYILPQEEYIYPENPLQPGDHYEETMSIGPEAEPRLRAALQELIRRRS